MLLAATDGAEKIDDELRPEKAWDLSSGPGFDFPHLHQCMVAVALMEFAQCSPLER